MSSTPHIRDIVRNVILRSAYRRHYDGYLYDTSDVEEFVTDSTATFDLTPVREPIEVKPKIPHMQRGGLDRYNFKRKR